MGVIGNAQRGIGGIRQSPPRSRGRNGRRRSQAALGRARPCAACRLTPRVKEAADHDGQSIASGHRAWRGMGECRRPIRRRSVAHPRHRRRDRAGRSLFVVVGLRYELQLYGDGAMFSYSVAAQDAWAFHWHNISGRLTVYLLHLAARRSLCRADRRPKRRHCRLWLSVFRGAALGLVATFAADRSQGPHHFRLSPVSRPLACARWSSASRPKCGWRMPCSGRRSPSAH